LAESLIMRLTVVCTLGGGWPMSRAVRFGSVCGSPAPTVEGKREPISKLSLLASSGVTAKLVPPAHVRRAACRAPAFAARQVAVASRPTHGARRQPTPEAPRSACLHQASRRRQALTRPQPGRRGLSPRRRCPGLCRPSRCTHGGRLGCAVCEPGLPRRLPQAPGWHPVCGTFGGAPGISMCRLPLWPWASAASARRRQGYGPASGRLAW